MAAAGLIATGAIRLHETVRLLRRFRPKKQGEDHRIVLLSRCVTSFTGA